MRTGASANGAIAARVGMVSEMSRRLNSAPCSVPVPVTASPSGQNSTAAPIRLSTRAKATSPCSESTPSPGTSAVCPVIAAAAKK